MGAKIFFPPPKTRRAESKASDWKGRNGVVGGLWRKLNLFQEAGGIGRKHSNDGLRSRTKMARGTAVVAKERKISVEKKKTFGGKRIGNCAEVSYSYGRRQWYEESARLQRGEAFKPNLSYICGCGGGNKAIRRRMVTIKNGIVHEPGGKEITGGEANEGRGC